MELKFLKESVKGLKTISRPILFQLKKHAPEILVGVGATSVVGGTVLACKTTLEVNAAMETEIPEGTDEEEARDRAVRAMGKTVVSYLPSAGMVLGGVAMLVAAKSIEHRRFTAMLGAYSTLQSSFSEYRGRVAADQGAEADLRYLNGAETEKVEFLEDQGDGKKPKKAKEEVTVFTAGENPYHRIFDEFNSLEWRENLEMNRYFLECQQTVLNQDLKREGRIFLNDVYKRLGFDYCEIGQFVGWLADDIEGCGDGYIDFGIDYAAMRSEISRALDAGERPEPSIWLNFNCDGEIWDKPLKKRYDN